MTPRGGAARTGARWRLAASAVLVLVITTSLAPAATAADPQPQEITISGV
jgi:hypothetical protein